MKRTLSNLWSGIYLSGIYPCSLALALTVTLLPAPVHAQSSDDQSDDTSRSATRRDARAGSHAIPPNYNFPTYPLAGKRWSIFFPLGSAYYAHYSLTSIADVTTFSPFCYYKTVPACILSDFVLNQPPQESYIPIPTYDNGTYRDKSGDEPDTTLLHRRPKDDKKDDKKDGKSGGTGTAGAAEQDPALLAAIADIAQTWNNNEYRSMAKHIRKDAPVAIFLKGKYFYSLNGTDYLGLTIDALALTSNVSFSLDTMQTKRKDTYKDIYVVSGRHTYTDPQGLNHTVMMTYVLEKLDNSYYITQIGAAPEYLTH